MSEFSITDINKELDAHLAHIEKIKKEVEKESAIVFKKSMVSFFEAFPEVSKILWTQYTPYFNDGDPCTFSLGEVYFVPKDVEDEDFGYWDYDDVAFSTYDDRKPSEELGIAMKAITSLINKLDDFLEDQFGDHMMITLTKDGIDTIEYDHD